MAQRKEKGSTNMVDTAQAPEQTDANPDLPQTNPEAGKPAEAGATKRTKKQRDGGYLYLATPPALRSKLDAEAAEKKISVRELVVGKLAAEYGVTLPKPVERKKYKTPEERKAAVNAQRKNKNALVALMMEKYAADMESLQKELEAKMAAEAEQAKAAEAAAAAAPATDAPAAPSA